MNKLELRIDWFGPNAKDLKEFLDTIEGIKNASVDVENNKVSLEFDPSLIPALMIKKQIDIFLKEQKNPNLLGFNRFEDFDKEATLNINKLCCEFCLKGSIEDLFEKDGIVSVESDFNFREFENVKVFIKFNSKLISDEDLKSIEEKINK